jgi:hypothetical protein
MVRGTDGSLYLVNAGIKLGFTSCSGDVVDYGYTCAQPPAQFINLTDPQINKLVSGPNVTKFMKSNAEGTIYYLSKGVKRPITSWDDYLGMHINQGINTFNDPLVKSYPTWYPIYQPGSLIKYPSSAAVYVVNDPDSALQISSFTYPQELGLSLSLRVIGGGYSPGALLENKILCSGSNYVSTNGSIYQVSSGMMTAYGFNSGQFVDSTNICPNLKTSAQALSQYIRTNDGTIYYVNNGQKQAFSSFTTYQSSSYCNNSTCTLTQVSNFFANSIPSGANL